MADYESVADIPWYVYRNGIKTLDIQQGVTAIGNRTFYYCSGLTEIHVDANNTHYCAVDGILFNESQDTLIQYPASKAGSSYDIPNSVTTIGDYAFRECTGLTSVAIGNSVTTIGYAAFYGCTGLTSIDIPNSVTAIGAWSFSGCSGLESITIPDSVTTIGDAAFQECTGLTSVAIGNGITTIEQQVFYNCPALTEITIPNSVTAIGAWSFSFCSGLESITIPSSVTTIGDAAFYRCSGLTGTLTIPNSVTTIEDAAFYRCSGLTSVTIGNSVTTIEGDAFRYCSGLTSVTIGNSVTTIGGRAFSDCTGLTELSVKAPTPPTLGDANYGDDAFNNVLATIPVHVPCGTADAYRSADGWDYFSNYVDDLPLVYITVESADPIMGTAAVTQANTCTDNTATIAATANEGYRFVKWNDDNADNPRTVTVAQDTTFTAEFEAIAIPVVYHITVNANNPDMGTVTGEGDYEENSAAVIEATANEGYRFVQWNDDNADNPRTVTVTEDMTFTAIFESETTGTPEIAADATVIYPNPVRDVLYIQSPVTVERVVIRDLNGKQVKQVASPSGEVNVSDLAAGVYLVGITTANGEIVRKIVIND
jgi:hypothetical protein